MSRTPEPLRVSHTTCCDPPVPRTPLRALARARMLAHASTPPRALGAALLTGDMALRGARARSAAWAGASARRALERAAPEVPRRRPSNPNLREQGRRVQDVSVVRGRRPPSSGGRLHVPARHQPVRWPRNQPLEVALQKAGGHASGMASVRRRRRVVAHRRGDLKMRDVLLVSIVVCVLT